MAKWAAEGRPDTDSDDEDDERLPDETEPVPTIPENDPNYYCKVHPAHS